MDRFNSKLYDSYKNLKKRKKSEMEEWNAKLESKYRNYELAAEHVIEELTNDNIQLRAQISAKEDDYAECQKTLIEGSQKNKELSDEVERLSDEVERLRNLLLAENPRTNNNVNNANTPLCSPHRSPKIGHQDSSKGSPGRMTPKRIKQRVVLNEATDVIPHSTYQVEQVMPDCWRGDKASSGDGGEKDHAKCMHQTLVESLTGMRFSLDSPTDGQCLSITHQSSGYTFSLTWLRNPNEEEGELELLYNVTSLGTLERVALEWMKEEIIFTLTMCPVFFEKISKVIGRG